MSITSRRNFIRQLAFGSESVVSQSGAKTLVCVFLRGGADTLNLVVPYGDDKYYALRPTIAVGSPSASDSSDAPAKLDGFYAFHPLLRPLWSSFKEGRLGIVQAVGSDNPTGSHFEAQDQMEHGERYAEKLSGGWIGRHLQTRASKSLTPLSAVAIGAVVPESLRSAPASSAITSVDEIQLKTPSGDSFAVASALSSMYGANVGVLAQPGRETLDLLKRVENLRGQAYKVEGGAQYTDDNFSMGLREIARLIKADVGLEIACIDLDGWDTHFFQGTTQGAQSGPINSLAKGLAAFDTDLQSYRDRVTTIVMTEFGRRTYENSSFGTDHGRGFAFLTLGNQINGGKIYGEWPGMEEDQEAGPGGLQVKVDYRSVLAEILVNVMGNREINRVFPGFQSQRVGLVSS